MNNSNKTDAAAYIRVSTEEQTEFSPESQLDKIIAYADKHGYYIKQENIFYDCGISGKSTNKREGFKSMIEKAKQKPAPFKAVLVWKFSRFARNREDSIFYKSMLRKKYGIKVISVSEDIGDDKMSLLVEAMIEAMDEFYSINLGEEVKRGMTKRAEKGKFQSKAPFGYRAVKGKLLPHEIEKEYIRLIFRFFLSGKSIIEICDYLNGIGVKTLQGNNWTVRAVKYILKNPVYAGYMLWNKNSSKKVLCKGEHMPIIDENDYIKCRSLLSIQNKRKNVKKHIDCWFLKFMYCSACGGKFCICGDGKNLQCINYIKHKCPVSHSISIKKIQNSLNVIIEDIFNKCYPLPSFQETNERNTPLQKDKIYYHMKKKYERAKEAYESGIYSLEDLQKAVSAFKIFKENFYQSESKTDTSFYTPKEFFNNLLNDNKISLTKKTALFSSVIEKIIFCRPEEKLMVIFKNNNL